MLFFGNSEVEELRKEHETQERHRIEVQQLKDSHREEIERMNEEKRNEHQELKGTVSSLESMINGKDNRIANLEAQLQYERDNRQQIIDAAIQKELGQYETRYYHDLHTFIEKHGEKFNVFQMGFMEKVLAAIQNMKPSEPKVMFVEKESVVGHVCTKSN